MRTKITQAAFNGQPFTGERNMDNRKPYRSQRQKSEAKDKARKCDDGTYRSTAPVSYHPRTAA